MLSRKRNNPICIECGLRPKHHTYSHCKECKKAISRLARVCRKDIPSAKPVVEFVNRVEKRNYMVSMEELFVELITLHSEYCIDKLYKNASPARQLEKMFKDLVLIRDKELKRKRIYENSK